MLNVKKHTWVFLSIALIAGCSQLVPTEPENTGPGAVTASIAFADGKLSALALTKIVLTVTGSGIDPITQNMNLTGGGASAQVKVPKDKQVEFTATAYKDTVQVMQGSTSYKPTSNNQQVKIDMHFLVPALILTPLEITVRKNDTVTIYINARHVSLLSTIGTQITFDPTRLQVTDLGREDDFLKSEGGSVNSLVFSKDNTAGTVDVVLGIVPGSTAAVSGDGKIARIVFQAVEAGTVNLSLLLDNAVNSNLGVFDNNANLVYSIGLGGRIQIN
ncbi:hypothetical protein JW935_07600 [candidate division KSB1 bacterium]|nr:hypothetical protein [candidate division KSB1 bacterium]